MRREHPCFSGTHICMPSRSTRVCKAPIRCGSTHTHGSVSRTHICGCFENRMIYRHTHTCMCAFCTERSTYVYNTRGQGHVSVSRTHRGVCFREETKVLPWTSTGRFLKSVPQTGQRAAGPERARAWLVSEAQAKSLCQDKYSQDHKQEPQGVAGRAVKRGAPMHHRPPLSPSRSTHAPGSTSWCPCKHASTRDVYCRQIAEKDMRRQNSSHTDIHWLARERQGPCAKWSSEQARDKQSPCARISTRRITSKSPKEWPVGPWSAALQCTTDLHCHPPAAHIPLAAQAGVPASMHKRETCIVADWRKRVWDGNIRRTRTFTG